METGTYFNEQTKRDILVCYATIMGLS